MTRTPPARRAVDWAALRRRLEVAAAGVAAPPGRQRAILEARARALAVAPPPPPGPQIEVLDFVVADEHYAVGTEWVRAVHPLRALTRLPGTPAFVLGIVPLHGEVVSVLDLKRFFDLPERGITDLDRLILLDDGAMRFGILADRILGVRALPLADVQPPLATLAGIRADYLLGVTRAREVVLDARKLLADPSIVVSDEVDR